MTTPASYEKDKDFSPAEFMRNWSYGKLNTEQRDNVGALYNYLFDNDVDHIRTAWAMIRLAYAVVPASAPKEWTDEDILSIEIVDLSDESKLNFAHALLEWKK